MMSAFQVSTTKRKRRRALAESKITSSRESQFLFIGRPCCPPFVFIANPQHRLSSTNIGWLKLADLDELEYLKEKAREAIKQKLEEDARFDNYVSSSVIDLTLSDDGITTPMTPRSQRRSNSHDNRVTRWTKAQERALWLGQVGKTSRCYSS